MEQFSEVLRRERKQQHLSQEKLGEQLDMGKAIIRMYENKQRYPTKNSLQKICEKLKLDYDYMGFIVAVEKYNINSENVKIEIMKEISKQEEKILRQEKELQNKKEKIDVGMQQLKKMINTINEIFKDEKESV